MDKLSQEVTNDSIKYIQQQIRRKTNYSLPYYTTTNAIKNSITDRNEFPYPRNYRGQANSLTPIIVEREAGYRMAKPFRFRFKSNYNAKPRMCFQYPCTVDFPCRAIEHHKSSSKSSKCASGVSTEDADQSYSTDYTTYSTEDDTPIPLPGAHIVISP